MVHLNHIFLLLVRILALILFTGGDLALLLSCFPTSYYHKLQTYSLNKELNNYRTWLLVLFGGFLAFKLREFQRNFIVVLVFSKFHLTQVSLPIFDVNMDSVKPGSSRPHHTCHSVLFFLIKRFALVFKVWETWHKMPVTDREGSSALQHRVIITTTITLILFQDFSLGILQRF